MKYKAETIVGIFVIIGLICVGYMTIKLGKLTLFDENYYSLYARFSSVSGLRTGGPVEMYGIEIGRISRLSVDTERQMALVEMKIKNTVKIHDDASATIKTSGLIGDKYVKIDPGGGGDVLKPGSFITETTTPPDIEDLIGKYAFGDVKKGPQKNEKKEAIK